VSAQIRDAREEDLPAILDIINDAILHTTARWEETPLTLEDRRAWLDGLRQRGFPVFVAVEDGEVAGFSSYGPFRNGSSYGATVEHSIYIARAFRGRGLSRALMEPLIAHATAGGKHAMIAAIGLPNEASVALHRKLGFVEVGRLPQIGRKKGQWLDLLLMQLTM
jgi:phosphinothricin acetyltransferase